MKFYIYENSLQLLKHLDTVLGGKDDNSLPNNSNNFYIHYPSLKMHDHASSQYSMFMNQLRNRDIFPNSQPQEADYFLVPIGIVVSGEIMESQPHINNAIKKMCSQLKFFETNPNKHVFFFLGDSFRPIDYLKNSIVFQTSCHKNNHQLKCIHYSSPIANKHTKNIIQAEYDVSFQGCHTHEIRIKIQNLIPLYNHKGLKCKYQQFNKIRPMERPPYEIEAKTIEIMNNSKFILCPRGAGLNSIRFFETLSYGRIPILIADHTSLPLENIIDYKKLIVKVPEGEIAELPNYVKHWLKNNDLVIASDMAKNIWEKYFADYSFHNMIKWSLKKCRIY
jgi:hypothetical protein